jgi:hypothetical protein
MSGVTFTITRKGEGMADYSVTFTEEQLGLVYDALDELGEVWVDNEDDNIHSVCMNKMYNLLEF